MAWGRSNERWNHTSALMWLLAAINSDPDSGRKPQIAHYHPFMQEPELPELPPGMLSQLLQGVKRPQAEATHE